MAFKHSLPILQLVISLIQTLHGVATLVPSRSLHLDTSLQGCDEDLELKKAFCADQGFNSVPQHLPRDIDGLNLDGNNITSLLNSSFRRYPLVTDLDLSINDIRVIEPTALHPLKHLTHLRMAFNSHILLSGSGLFKRAKNLSHLDLLGSHLRSIPNDILKWSRNLNTVDLSHNFLTVINISSCGTARHVDLSYNKIESITEDAFNFVCNSETLDLTNNPIRSVDQNVIASLHVRSLKLGRNALTIEELRDIFIGISRSVIENFTLNNGADLSVVPEDLFDPLRDCSLRILDLNMNKLQAPYPFVFSNLTRLRQFHLQENGIIKIEPNFFEGMHNLRILDLNENHIKEINMYNIPWTIDLTELHLSGNSLTTIEESTFRGLHNLTLLDLRSNKLLMMLEATSFFELKNIQNIDLSNCNIILSLQLVVPSVTSLFLNNMEKLTWVLEPTKSFKNVRLLEHLEMINSGLLISNLWDPYVNVSLFDGLFNLTALDLSKNPIDSVSWNTLDLPPGVLQQLSALQNLSLEDCNLSILHPQAFTGLKSLRVLILKNNQLEHLPVDLFKPLDQVTIIDLVDNLLADLNGAIVLDNRKLKTLLLSNNKLTRLEQNTFKPLYYSLLFIDLSMNPINCNCDLSWFLDWLSGPLSLIDDDDNTICSSVSLKPLRGEHLIDFDPREFCSINIALVCLPIIATICLIFIVALVYHNRWQLRYRLFLLKLAALGYEEMRDARDHNDYEFDLNVIFYDDDENWIREHLRPALAERLPQFQRNVFGDEELVLGMHYLESVDYVVSHSYKTIVVLSRAAVHDHWFILKFRTAMDHVSDTLTEFVVVVFLEDIPDDEMPFLARLYLSDGRPYIHWTEDVRGHEYFFDKLTKNLTINLRTNDWIPNE
eukprot:XP_011683911.1 PREDICTED: toll-like receptor 3 [Strongylocentrotus purpuratus]